MTTALNLFISFLKIGALSFGGAQSFYPLVEREVVTGNGWLSQSEFEVVVGMSQTFPGAVSIKFATYVGFKELGLLGVVIANVANALPPILLMGALTALFLRFGQHPRVKGGLEIVSYAALGLMAALVAQFLLKSTITVPGVVIMIAAAAAVLVLKAHPGYVILGALVVGGIRAALMPA
jgi:chromate transporter